MPKHRDYGNKYSTYIGFNALPRNDFPLGFHGDKKITSAKITQLGKPALSHPTRTDKNKCDGSERRSHHNADLIYPRSI
jgi:hypothetical protein